MSIIDFWPFPYKPRDIQVQALEWLEQQTAKYVLLEAPVGCHLAGTPILMFDGSVKPVEHIAVGDILMGPDSTPRTVLSLHTGTEQMYTITPVKGTPFVVNKNHIMSLITTNARRSGFNGKQVINISVEEYLNTSNDFKRNIKLYRSTGIDFASNKDQLPIDPYFLGLILGDGTICNGHIGITTTNLEIKQEIYAQAQKYNLQVNVQGISYYISSGRRGGAPSVRSKNYFIEALKEIKLYNTRSGTKFIPLIYKTAPRAQRLQLLAGLIDTDGYYKRVFNIVTKSKELSEDIMYIARSLGFAANSFIRTVNNNQYIDVTISGNLDTIPTRVPKKQAAVRRQKKRVHVTAFSVVPYGMDTFYGFEVNGDHLFLLGDFTVVHNSGKSNVGVTYSRFLGTRTPNGDSYIITPQRILQEQYETSFKGNDQIQLALLWGKGNYDCKEKGVTCDIGSLVKPKCEYCVYNEAMKVASKAPNTVLNYKLALILFRYRRQTFGSRKLIVFDECHTLENHLVDFDAVSFTRKRTERYKGKWVPHKTIPYAIQWVEQDYYPKFLAALELHQALCEDIIDGHRRLSRAEIGKLRELNSMLDHGEEVSQLLGQTLEYLQEHFVLVNDKETMQFKRLTGAYTFQKIVSPVADRVLFMSSTILDKNGFCRDLGIDPNQAAFLSLDSEFPVDRRPIFYAPQMKVNYQWKQPENARGREKLANMVIKIAQEYKEESGIIHTANFQLAEWFVDQLKDKVPHIILHHNPNSGDDRNTIVNAFVNGTKPTILISPSSTEGLDLKDNLARFAIFVKVPYGNLGDQWIKRRMEISSEWYQRRAVIDVIQGSGRVVRSKEDWGHVFILDAAWSYLYTNMIGSIPKWWKKALIKI